jgi:hypothetical protein
MGGRHDSVMFTKKKHPKVCSCGSKIENLVVVFDVHSSNHDDDDDIVCDNVQSCCCTVGLN